MDENLTSAYKTVAFLMCSLVTAIVTMVVMLLISAFYNISLPMAFTIQFIAGLLGGLWSIWRKS